MYILTMSFCRQYILHVLWPATVIWRICASGLNSRIRDSDKCCNLHTLLLNSFHFNYLIRLIFYNKNSSVLFGGGFGEEKKDKPVGYRETPQGKLIFCFLIAGNHPKTLLAIIVT